MEYEVDTQDGTEVEEQLQRFQQAVHDLRDALQQLTASPPRSAYDRQQATTRIHRLQQEASVCSRSVALELRCSSSLLTPESISRLVRRQRSLQEQFASISEECETQLLAVSKEQLLERVSRGQEPPQETPDLSAQQQRQQLVMLGDEVQDQTQISLARTQQLVAETEDMGGAILHKMQQQNEQLEGVKDRLDDVQFNLAQAKKTAQTIAKNAASDRCMQCLCCCVTLLLIASVVLIALPGK
ncbi:novel plant SNARE 12-like [Cyclospora cayetanensis]|nr:novel plant SNARE 12-like [Cyclospora cayetanensis]